MDGATEDDGEWCRLFCAFPTSFERCPVCLAASRAADEQAARIRALEQMIVAHEWCSSIDEYPACPECGESPYAVDTGTGEPIPGTHNPGCAWGEAAKRGKTPGGEG